MSAYRKIIEAVMDGIDRYVNARRDRAVDDAVRDLAETVEASLGSHPSDDEIHAFARRSGSLDEDGVGKHLVWCRDCMARYRAVRKEAS